uniref:Glutathione S-transferase Z4 n=1 Tax=Brachionus rotundiformis TaxID=96890 RepID=A0A3G2JSG1_9BILA|nr:glutathione S-transferase Z4 [Brachionus rotundiformis]
MDPKKPILYNYFRSSSSWRVRIALELKKIDYEYKPISLIKDGGEQYSEEFTKINPKQEVPALHIDGHLLLQSLPIIEYLDETRPNEHQLLPIDSVKRAKARMIAEIINSGMQPFQNLNVIKRVAAETQSEEKKMEWIKFYLTKGFKAVEEALQETSGKYCVGDQITIADLCLVPQVYSAKRFNIDLNEFPNVRRVNEQLEKIPEFIKAHAHRQIDTPKELQEN